MKVKQQIRSLEWLDYMLKQTYDVAKELGVEVWQAGVMLAEAEALDMVECLGFQNPRWREDGVRFFPRDRKHMKAKDLFWMLTDAERRERGSKQQQESEVCARTIAKDDLVGLELKQPRRVSVNIMIEIVTFLGEAEVEKGLKATLEQSNHFGDKLLMDTRKTQVFAQTQEHDG